MTEIDPTVIKRTQDALGKFVKKPPLTEKLLKKPPFRFLHDVFNVVINDKGYFEGLYTPEELNFENIKDRDDKMRFLQKMIDVIKILTNAPLSVRTSKIVAGQEVEKTNELLQLMGEVIEKRLDYKSAVAQVLGAKGEEKVTTKTKPKADKTKDVKSKDKTKEVGKTREVRAKDGKVSSKNISPTDKNEKPKRTADSKGKEKTSKIAVKESKVGKENREKDKLTKKSKDSSEKPKLTKTKEEVKEKTPSPVKTEPREEQKNSLERVKAVDNAEVAVKAVEKFTPAEEAEVATTKVVTPEKVAVKEPKVERRASKNAEDLQQPLIEPAENVSNTLEMPKAPGESRKSSAQRKSSASSVKSRRSSANKGQRAEVEGSQPSLNNLESLNESAAENAAKQPVKQQSTQPHPPAVPPTPKPAQANGEAVRRESTFTRENSRDSNSIGARPRTSLRPPSARPPSARPGAPRRRDKNVEIVLQPNDQVKLSGINVKLETFGDLDDDGENLVIIEDANADNIMGMNDKEMRNDAADAMGKLEQQGHLVQQILETQKELVQGGDDQTIKPEKDGLNTRQSSARQMNNLRDVIQNLTKSVNPFGKLMDFIPEDIDAMQLELTMWRDSYLQASNELKREKSLTESATEPMKNQLIQIEANIKEYLEMIDASRVKILQNTDKILKMLTEQ